MNGEKIMCGDYNARLRCRFAGEDQIIGQYYFEGVKKMPDEESNRNMLI